MSLFDGLITSRMRVNILMRLFLNPGLSAYTRELAGELGASSSQVSDELKKLDASGLLMREKQGRQVRYRANTGHPLYPELQSMVRKALGMDRVLDSIIERIGNIEAAYVVDDYAEGRDSGIIDLVLIGDIDQFNLQDLVVKTERYIQRRIRTLVLSHDEYLRMQPTLALRPRLLLWENTGVTS